MSDRTISKGLHPGVTSVVVARPEISTYHLRFAREKRRAGIGWQNIAQMLGVNRDDIQRAVESGATPGEPEAPRTPCAPAKPVRVALEDPRPDSVTHRIMMEIQRAVNVAPKDVALALDLDVRAVFTLCGRLRNRGWIERARDRDRIQVTASGCDMLDRVARSVRPVARTVARVERVLVALDDGLSLSADIARSTGFAAASVSNDLRSLEERGLAQPRRDTSGGRAFVWRPTPAGVELAAQVRARQEAARG